MGGINERVDRMGLNWNTILMVVLVGLLSWNLSTTQQLAVDMSAMKQQILIVTEDRYTSTQALTDKEILQGKLDSHSNWLQNLSERLAKVEQDLREDSNE